MLVIKLSPDIEKRLTVLAKATGRTKTYYARTAILAYLEDMEDLYLALDRLKEPEKRWIQLELEQGHDLAN